MTRSSLSSKWSGSTAAVWPSLVRPGRTDQEEDQEFPGEGDPLEDQPGDRVVMTTVVEVEAEEGEVAVVAEVETLEMGGELEAVGLLEVEVVEEEVEEEEARLVMLTVTAAKR